MEVSFSTFKKFLIKENLSYRLNFSSVGLSINSNLLPMEHDFVPCSEYWLDYNRIAYLRLFLALNRQKKDWVELDKSYGENL